MVRGTKTVALSSGLVCSLRAHAHPVTSHVDGFRLKMSLDLSISDYLF